jgi:ribosomal protein S8
MNEFLALVQKQIVELLYKEGYIKTNDIATDTKIRYAKYTFMNGTYYEGEWDQGIFKAII